MAIRGSSPVNVNLGMLDTRPAIQANAMVQQANVNLANSVNQAVNNFVQAKEKKENEQISINAIQSLLGITDPNLAKAIVKDPAVGKAFQFQREQQQLAADRKQEMELAKLEAGQGPDFSTQLDLEDTGAYVLPPDEDNPAGSIIYGGFAKEGDFSGRLVFSRGAGEQFQVAPSGTLPYNQAAKNNIEDNLRGAQDTIKKEQAAINALKDYYGTRKETSQGVEFLVDSVLAKAKTLFGQELTRKELLTQIGRGQFEGLLGRIRLDILGGGVLTEKDAQRLERALGNYGVTSNPAVVREVLASIIKSKKATESQAFGTYERNLRRDPELFNIYKDNPFSPIDVSEIMGTQTSPPPTDDNNVLDEASKILEEAGID
jgi:hypothetical protein